MEWRRINLINVNVKHTLFVLKISLKLYLKFHNSHNLSFLAAFLKNVNRFWCAGKFYEMWKVFRSAAPATLHNCYIVDKVEDPIFSIFNSCPCGGKSKNWMKLNIIFHILSARTFNSWGTTVPFSLNEFGIWNAVSSVFPNN